VHRWYEGLHDAYECNGPTLLKDEKFSADMNPFEAGRGDLVLFDHEGQLLLKRVIAVGGDVIEGRDLKVFLNGNLLDEPYIQHTAKRPLGMKTLETFGPIRVSVGMLFVAGDNRDYSFHSRDPKFGLVSRGDVRGRPIQVLQSTNPARNGKSLK
jgi:signal peptidase I